MRDSFMHDLSIAPSYRWLRVLVVSFALLAGTIAAVVVIEDGIGDSSCGGG